MDAALDDLLALWEDPLLPEVAPPDGSAAREGAGSF